MTEEVIIVDCRLILGDCREVLPGLPVHDLLLTDPQYGIGRDKGMGGGGFDSTGRYARKPRQYYGEWDEERPSADEFNRIICASKAAVIWGGNYFADLLPQGAKWLVWNKEQVMPSYSDAELAWTNLDGQSVKLLTIHCNKARIEMGYHPTQKPIALMEWCMSFAQSAQTVIDPFMGSGTTGVACVRLGKSFTGIERERKYFDIACERIENAYRQAPLVSHVQAKQVQEALL